MRKQLLQCALLGLLSGAARLSAADTPQALMDNEHWKRARSVVEQNYRANPKDPETLWAMSRIRQAWHDMPAALDFAEKALAANPKEARYHFQVGDVVGEMAEKAGILHQVSLGRRFKKEMDATLAIDPNHILALANLIGYYFMAPGIIGGDKAKGRAIADQIMRLDPVAGANAQIVVANLEKQQHVPYEEIFRKAIAARPDAYMPHVQLANILFEQKKYDDARQQGHEAIRIDPGRAAGHTIVAVSLVFQSKWTELDAALSQAEKDVPDNLSPFYRSAVVCLTNNVEFPRAERYMRHYLTQEPEPDAPPAGAAHWRLGQIVEKQGRKAEAIAEWQTAVKMDPTSKAKDDLKRVK